MPYRQSLQGSPEVHLLQSYHDSLRQPQQQNELFLCLQVPEKRSMDIKAKKLRREGYVVGNVFGKKIEGSIPVKFQKLELEKFLKKAHKGIRFLEEKTK